MVFLPGSQSSPSPSRIKFHFPTMVACLIMYPSLVAFSTLSFFPTLLFHLPSEFLASESLSQELTSEKPKLSHYLGIIQYILSSQWHHGKESACQCSRHQRPGFDSWVGKIPWRRKWQPSPVFLPGKIQWTEGPGRLQSMGLQSQTRLSQT